MFNYLELRKIKLILEKDLKTQQTLLDEVPETSVAFNVMNETLRQDKILLEKINRLAQEAYKDFMGGNFIEKEVK